MPARPKYRTAEKPVRTPAKSKKRITRTDKPTREEVRREMIHRRTHVKK